MIRLSRPTLLVASSLLVASCSEKVCNTIGCISGLTVELSGDRDGGVPATPFQIDFAKLVGQEAIPLMTCTYTATADGSPLVCNPEITPNPFAGSGIYFADTDIRMLRVTTSANGTQLSEETVSPNYTSREVWGPGCGYCTQATVRVTLPPP